MCVLPYTIKLKVKRLTLKPDCSVPEFLWSGQGSNPRPPARQIAISFPESALLCQPERADQKDRGLWERDWPDCRVHTIYMIFNLTRLSYLLTNGNIRIILLTSYNLFYKMRLTQNCQNSKIKYFIYLSN